jgi:tRNA dimethylallyltransferase
VIVAIVGPTAAGKTARAVALAAAHGGEIVSCDSMQVYRGADLGTAKPDAEERRRAPHHLIDVVAPDEPFSAARYVGLADAAIAAIAARGRPVFIVGGTGLYLRALRWGLFEAPGRDEALRRALLDEERARPGALHARLAAVDPASAARLAPRDLVRLVRALEVHALTGRPISAHHAAHAPVARHAMRVFVIDPDPAWLEARIAARVGAMLSAGLVDEAVALRARYGPGIAVLQAVGYKEALLHADGHLTAAALAPTIVRATRRYARRQRTWFRKEPDARFVPTAEAIELD